MVLVMIYFSYTELCYIISVSHLCAQRTDANILSFQGARKVVMYLYCEQTSHLHCDNE